MAGRGQKSGGEKNISIPSELYERIESEIEGTEFSSVEEYVIFVLSEMFADDDSDEEMTEADKEAIRERLRALGYIE